MESRRLCRLFFMSTWMFLFLLPCGCSGASAPYLSLDTRVSVALAGTELTIKCNVTKPAMTPEDTMTCFSPHNTEIYSCDLKATNKTPEVLQVKLHLGPLNGSGQYYCQYHEMKAYWFLRVRDGGYTNPADYTESIILGFLIVVLLVFSVIGSVYVFRELPKQENKCDEMRGKQKQKREERKPREIREDNAEVTTASATSVYASLELRPGSIYDVLDRSAASRDSTEHQEKAEAKKNQPQKTTEQTTQHKEEGVFESVYENF